MDINDGKFILHGGFILVIPRFLHKKEAAKIVGKYNLKYKLSSDYDYFYRMIVKHRLKGIGT